MHDFPGYPQQQSSIPRWQLAVLLMAMLPGFVYAWQLGSAAVHASFAPAEPTVFAEPSVLYIPSLNVEAPIDNVGTLPNGDMGIPKDIDTVGWFERGARPGETGSMVMAGHLDGPWGQTAVFAELSTINAGERIIVKDATGRGHIYVVEAIESYETENAPLERIFASDDQPRLTLITCSGTWDAQAWSYDHRLVVYAVLDED